MRTRWGVGIAAVMISGLVTLGGSETALAQGRGAVSESAKDIARKAYRSAEQKAAEGDYASALALYVQAESTVPVPATKYKIAACYDKLGQVSEAVKWYQTFLDSGPSDKLAEAIVDARVRLSALRHTPGQLRVDVSPPNPPKLTYTIDDGPAQRGPLLRLSPGHHRIVAQAHGYEPFTTDVDIAPGDIKDLHVSLLPAGSVALGPGPGPVPPPPPPYVSTRRSNVPAYVMFGLTGASAIVGTAFGALALKDKGDFNKNPTTDGADKTHRDALISDISFGATAVFAVAGLVLILTNLGPSSDTSAHVFVTPYAGPKGAGGTFGVRF